MLTQLEALFQPEENWMLYPHFPTNFLFLFFEILNSLSTHYSWSYLWTGRIDFGGSVVKLEKNSMENYQKSSTEFIR